MRYLIPLLILLASTAQAQIYQETIITPDGRMVTCTTIVNGTHSTTTCH